MEKKPNHTRVEFDLPPEANPVEWVKIPLDKVHKLRWLYCHNYNECLTYAAGQSWGSFVCIFCPVWARKKKGRKHGKR